MKGLHVIAWILLIIGGLNWGLVGLNADWNVVAFFGDSIARIVYVLVGLSALYELFTHKKGCRSCGNSGQSM